MIESIEFLGRFHPVLLHLPIGIFVFVFGLEVMSRFKKDNAYYDTISIGLLCGLITSIGTCISGLLLANGGDYEGSTIDQHKWMGIGMTVAAALIYYLHRITQTGKSHKLYLPAFSALMILLTITGHKGGSITHGEGFLTGASEAQELAFEDINQAQAYQDIISPILKTKCVSCHNESKAKGKLIMASKEELLKGGENGVILLAGNPKKSMMMNRIHLPLEEKEHMPPKSKKQLTTDEVSLLEWWIQEGADFEALVGQLKQSEPIAAILKKYTKVSDAYANLKIKPASDQTLASLVTAGVPTKILARTNPLVEVDLSHRSDLSKSIVSKVKKVDDQLSILDLAFSNVDDNMLSGIKNFEHLRNLQLQKTKITDKTVQKLKDLKFLKILNLYGTSVTDDIMPVLAELPSLKSVYLWESQVSDSAVAQLQRTRPLLEISYKQDISIFGDAALKPPLIVSEKDFFKDSLTVEFQLNFKNINFYYTLDGTDPDSTSALYTTPINIKETTSLKVISVKKGWKNSEVASRQFVKSTYDIASIKLTSRPADKYKGSGAATLFDFTKGTIAFTDGNWLGYEGKNFNAIIDLGAPEEISNVTVSALDASASWVFYPRGMKIWTSEDGKNYTFQKNAEYKGDDNVSTPTTSNFSEDITPTRARYVKLEVKSQLKNPDWHPNPGGKSWLFLDEVFIN